MVMRRWPALALKRVIFWSRPTRRSAALPSALGISPVNPDFKSLLPAERRLTNPHRIATARLHLSCIVAFRIKSSIVCLFFCRLFFLFCVLFFCFCCVLLCCCKRRFWLLFFFF